MRAEQACQETHQQINNFSSLRGRWQPETGAPLHHEGRRPLAAISRPRGRSNGGHCMRWVRRLTHWPCTALASGRCCGSSVDLHRSP